ncbi:nucleotidyltransferase [Flavobacterium sp. MFBS3-15]|uniref:nucleotidyl transferase AbiEii/AbiGii toxin family protein n=1 Tax=Flavobacterium sp. MFBS3-15 TaxID=2989816 RepID=UPI002235711C|nr:nucleotidyl transferase AbiEii/AbiGii toxin family protein [Flavobacterium sp. MFBS3-15]MCW4469541.1 nucleotidyltransferase [Flavobacterium sp. MFBS3-15]
MLQAWNESISTFITLANKHNVRMLMVGGGAVNFHGYQRHSADVDFWIETTEENFRKLVTVFNEMGFEVDDFPDTVKNQQQNISIKFTPQEDMDLELITNFSVNKSFEQAYTDSVAVEVNETRFLRWSVLSLEDLITSKVKAGRPKDLLDIQQLRKINNDKK